MDSNNDTMDSNTLFFEADCVPWQFCFGVQEETGRAARLRRQLQICYLH